MVVGLIAGASAAVSLVVIWHQRTLGTYDPDESGYLATALRYQRVVDPHVLLAVPRAVRATVSGPLVPLLSVVTLVIGPRDPRSAMAIQPVLMVVTAVSAAGITRRLARPAVAIMAGALVAGVPTMLLASESYWLGLGAAAAMAVTVWALLASDRLGNRWTWAFGVGLAALMLARTMTLGFLPGIVAAGVYLAWGDRRRLLRLTGALAVAAAIAAPWWILQRHAIFGYLFGYGYGARATRFGSGDAVVRFVERTVVLSLDAGLPLPLLIPLGVVAWWRRRSWWAARRTSPGNEVMALMVIVGAGVVALASTSNMGVWFDLPLVVLTVPVVLALLQRSPRRLQVVLFAWVGLVALGAPIVVRALGVLHYDTDIGRYDARFDRDRPGDHAVAARQWWSVDRRVTGELARLTGRGTTGIITMTGNSYLFNSNTIALAAELDLWNPTLEVPDTTVPAPGLSRYLTRSSDQLRRGGIPKERILVVVRQAHEVFTPDTQWRALDRAARHAGWSTVATFPLPSGGEVAILRFEPPVHTHA